ncbi:MAG: putative NAD(P)/FAD-binding protein YdhS [Ascidiaceihabitans sp.]|jgi:uncharacterized NAD(P)/FAD-binding protein YdhS
MILKTAPKRLAIIGFGPRGLGALEALADQVSGKRAAVKIDIFDPFQWTGAGPNFNPDQSDLCILNIPVRALDIDPPAQIAHRIAPFPEWSKTTYQPDDFPPRSDLGAYLHARFHALCSETDGFFDMRHFQNPVTTLSKSDDGWWVDAQGKQHGPYDEVLLTQGQPDTAPDPQLKRWMGHATDHSLELRPAYPANALIDAAKNWAGKTVAVRGLGLSTLDVVRMLTMGLGGEFKDGVYIRSGNEPHKILPFSLDGTPPASKPATGKLDDRFSPNGQETQDFEAALSATLSQDPADALDTICEALIKPTARILRECDASKTENDVRIWLDAECKNPGTQDARDAVSALGGDIEMAHGRQAPSVGYVVGQLWRKWQNEIRSGVNSVQHRPETAAAIVGFDEGLKRFSYGPPVSASEDLLALINAGVVSLCAVDGPAVILQPDGWCLLEGEEAFSASIMVDAVLPNPDLLRVTDLLIATSVSNGNMHPIADGLGAHVLPNGQMMGSDGNPQQGFCMLGRLSLGSVIAADSLHDCFGSSTTRWAEGVVERILDRPVA